MLTAALALGLCLALAPAPAAADDCAGLKVCYKGSLGKKGGVPSRWYVSDKHPIHFYVNASLLPAAKQQAAIDAVKAAFAAFQLPCTTLKFKYAGASTSFSDVPGGILIYWGNKSKDSSSWIHGNAAYWRYMNINSYQTGEISYAYMAFNAGLYGWNAGGTAVQPPPKSAKNSIIDIKTAVTWLIPDVLGYMATKDPTKPDLPIAYKTQLKALCAAHKTGATYSYFKKTSASCTKPTTVKACAGGFDPGDGVLSDGFFGDMAARKDKGPGPGPDGGGSLVDGASASADGGGGQKCSASSQCPAGYQCTIEGICVKVGGEDDEGCSCRAGGTAPPAAMTLMLALVLGLGLRRRRERSR